MGDIFCHGSACLPPAIENGKYEEAQSGGYKNHDEITITCEDGFDMKLRSGRIQCSNGRWSRLPVCERSIYACDKPGKIRHAVIINQEPKEVYGHNSQLEYQCEDGYTTGQENHLNKITCQDGTWTEAQSCTRSARPGPPDTQTTFVSIDRCGEIPHVPNGLPVQQEQRYLKYKCQMYYKLVGPETVVCHRGGTWSELPKCKEDFCLLNTAEYPDLINTGNTFIRNGKTEYPKCVDRWMLNHYVVARCIEGRLRVSECCSWAKIQFVSICVLLKNVFVAHMLLIFQAFQSIKLLFLCIYIYV
ncbi:complement factor H-like isoform X2 [Poecilia reticulata]|uniref:complement factor H-like isoform X2 n=1 Tax=Poecilia reticulata TaxID=8081 RepID=UPI0007E9BFD0|nr:PREDICTED: complement factor H-like isoform X2 [Poecilia reticulata]